MSRSPAVVLPVAGVLRLGLAACVVGALAGCVVHQARAVAPADGPGADGVTILGEAQHPAGPAQEAMASGPLPQTVPVTAWRWRVATDGRTELVRDDLPATSTEPWWDRFPLDLAADFWPQDVVAAGERTVTFLPVPDRDPAEVAVEAAEAGFFRPRTGP